MNHLIQSRQYTSIHPLPAELQYQPNTNYLFDLDYLSVLQVVGDKGAECLQGQLSCDMRAVTDIQMRQGLMCNLKGRIMAIMDVMMMSNQSIALVVPTDLSVDTQAALAKPAAFSRVQLHTTSLKVYGFFLQDERDVLPLGMSLPTHQYDVVHSEAAYCYQLDASFYVCIVQAERAGEITEPFIQHDHYRGSLAWHALQLQHHRVEIYPESRGLFLPHRLDMHLSGYINFEKGCYKGQEIIARMHYRSTQKHVLMTFVMDTDVAPIAGQPLYADDGETSIGEIIDYCIVNNHRYLISASVLKSAEHGFKLNITGQRCRKDQHE